MLRDFAEHAGPGIFAASSPRSPPHPLSKEIRSRRRTACVRVSHSGAEWARLSSGSALAPACYDLRQKLTRRNMEPIALRWYATLSGLVFVCAFLIWRHDGAVAAWLQAAFSVVAIYAAIWLSHVQAVRDRGRELESEQSANVRRLESILAIAEYAHLVLREIAAKRADTMYLDAASGRRAEISRLDDAKVALGRIPLHDVTPWDVAAAVLALSRAVDDTRSAIESTSGLVVSWSPVRAQPYSDSAVCADQACEAIRGALVELGASTQEIRKRVGTYHRAQSPSHSTEPQASEMRAPQDDGGQPIYVQFSDESYRDIVSYFGGPQDPVVCPHQGKIYPSDSRYRAFYESLHETSRQGMPIPR